MHRAWKKVNSRLIAKETIVKFWELFQNSSVEFMNTEPT